MNKEQKLLERPVEEDTEIILQNIVTFKECLGLMERWRWESIKGSSIIILMEDVKNHNREELIKSLLEQIKVSPETKITSKEDGEYFYLNFNFVVG